MKDLKLSFLILGLFISHNCYSQSGWVWCNPSPSGSGLSSVVFLNEFTGFAVTDKGGILKSTNKGSNWQFIETCTDAWLYSACFLNVDTGFVVGAGGTIIKTTNGGLNWFFLLTNQSEDLYKVSFTSLDSGWACGTNSVILFTSNAGNDWVRKGPQTSYNFGSLYFIDSKTGWCTTKNLSVFKTTNSGLNWVEIALNIGNNITDIHFANESTGWISADYHSGSYVYYRVLKTTNGGYNWFSTMSSSITYINDIFFLDTLQGWAVGPNNLLRTTDGGNTWISQPGYSLNSIFFLNSMTGWIVGDYGHILLTSNGGINWVNVDTAISYNSISDILFHDHENGLLATGYGELFSSTNGGSNWALKFNFNQAALSDMDFINDNTGWVVFDGGGGKIMKSTNGGNSWEDKSIGNLNDIYTAIKTIKFVNIQTGFIGVTQEACYNCFDEGAIYKSSNAGNNWFRVLDLSNNGFDDYLRCVQFINEQTGWFAGGSGFNGIIARTTNGGMNWNEYYTNSDMPHEFWDMYFVNSVTGWVCGRKGIMKSTDSGMNWFTQNVPNTNQIYRSLCFVNAETGWVGDLNGNTFVTTNGGSNWVLKYNPSRSLIRKILFLDEHTGFIVGGQGTILKTTNAGGNFIVNAGEFGLNIPSIFSLSQNYPNPFNPQTKIKFGVPSNVKGQTSNVKLVIYDLLGREVATLVNEELKPGTYEADWDGSIFSSGVYFYKIISGDFVETKKMVLMK